MALQENLPGHAFVVYAAGKGWNDGQRRLALDLAIAGNHTLMPPFTNSLLNFRADIAHFVENTGKHVAPMQCIRAKENIDCRIWLEQHEIGALQVPQSVGPQLYIGRQVAIVAQPLGNLNFAPDEPHSLEILAIV